MMATAPPSDTTKRIVEMHRGDISVESEPGRGSTFKVRLPYTQGGK
ncbi:ATP-binding protein [Alicyclobacillus acidocaldarius]